MIPLCDVSLMEDQGGPEQVKGQHDFVGGQGGSKMCSFSPQSVSDSRRAASSSKHRLWRTAGTGSISRRRLYVQSQLSNASV
jgi:hypothetical protein